MRLQSLLWSCVWFTHALRGNNRWINQKTRWNSQSGHLFGTSKALFVKRLFSSAKFDFVNWDKHSCDTLLCMKTCIPGCVRGCLSECFAKCLFGYLPDSHWYHKDIEQPIQQNMEIGKSWITEGIHAFCSTKQITPLGARHCALFDPTSPASQSVTPLHPSFSHKSQSLPTRTWPDSDGQVEVV